MTDLIQPKKDLDNEHPVPTVWRKKLSSIVNALSKGDFSLEHEECVNSIPSVKGERFKRYIESCGVHLSELPELTWETSVCMWMDGFWEVMVDLFTEEEGRSDLVLFLKVFENGDSYRFSVESLHVP